MNLNAHFRRLAALALALLLALLFAPGAAAADGRDDGPLTLAITYHVAPANRAALREQMEGAELAQFQAWKDEGILQDYRVLFSRYVDTANWDMLALLTFARYADVERWKRIEQTHPAGLSAKALALTTSINSVALDLARNERLPGTPDSVFMVIPYHVVIPTDEYLNYVDGYLVPQTEGWMQEGALAGYGLYLVRYTADRPWESLLILEYAGDHGLGKREAVVAKVRERLKANAKWKAISDGKKDVRVERQAVVADALHPAL
jgi:hypothetical protein